MKTKNILIISHGEIGTQMAGTGIRYHYMAETLQAAGFDVTVGFFSPEYMPDKKFHRTYNVESVNIHDFQESLHWADVVIALWVSEAILDFCNTYKKLLIIDMYAPVPVENLALKIFSSKPTTEADEFAYTSSLKDYRKFLENADAFLCSNERQIDFWLGYTFGANQVSPKTYAKRDVFKQFLLAPMGIDSKQKLVRAKPLYKGVLPGVGEDDIVMIWNGGIYDWYDGTTLIEAMELVYAANPKIKLIFPGTEHPNKSLPKWQETIDTQERARELGIENKNVFFFKKWIDYHDRVGFLLEADIAIYTHKPSIESEFSHRTRVLDHMLASLPTIATAGDYFASFVRQHDLGRVVPAYDKVALANAIVDLAKRENLEITKHNIQKVRAEFDWTHTLTPLVDFLRTNPEKVCQVATFRPTPLQNRRLRHIKRYTPVAAKKAIARATPRRIRRKLLG